MARMKPTNPREKQNQAMESEDYHDYFIKYLNNKKMTYYKKLEKIAALKLKDPSKLQKEQVEMMEKTPLWHEKIAEWNKIQAYYLESIRRYKPELLDPSLGDSEESKLRLEIQDLKKKVAELEEQSHGREAEIEGLKAQAQKAGDEAKSMGVGEAVGRVVQLHNFVQCSEKYEGLCGNLCGKGPEARADYAKAFAQLGDLEEVQEGAEEAQKEALMAVVNREALWKSMGRCCEGGILVGCQKKLKAQKQKEEEERLQKERELEEEKKRQEEEEKKKKEEEEKPKEEFGNFVDDDESEDNSEEGSEDGSVESESEKKEEKPKEEPKPKNEEDDLMAQFFGKKEGDWKQVPDNKPPRSNRRGRGRYNKGKYREGDDDERGEKRYRGKKYDRKYNKKYHDEDHETDDEGDDEKGNRKHRGRGRGRGRGYRGRGRGRGYRGRGRGRGYRGRGRGRGSNRDYKHHDNRNSYDDSRPRNNEEVKYVKQEKKVSEKQEASK